MCGSLEEGKKIDYKRKQETSKESIDTQRKFFTLPTWSSRFNALKQRSQKSSTYESYPQYVSPSKGKVVYPFYHLEQRQP